MIKIVDTNFNSFIVTNLRLCVSNKLLLLVKVPTPFKSSLIDRMSFIISKNNCWCILKCLRVWRIRDLTLVSNKTIREREKERERKRDRETDRVNNHPQRRKVGWLHLFTSHLSIQNKNDNVEWIAAFLKKLFRHNEYYWDSPSKQIHSFHYLRRSRTFLWKINNSVVDA